MNSKIMTDTRPGMYRYYDQLIKHIDNAGKIFDGNMIYPRQFEIHLPGNHVRPCDLNCPHCAGKFFDKYLGNWEITALDLLNKLRGATPYHIYGGAYTEPTINPYFMTFLHTTKKHGNHFGIHTNGVNLNHLEKNMAFLTILNEIATDAEDYLSISLDAGSPYSWQRTKGSHDARMFYEIIEGIAAAVAIRERRGRGHAIRVCYLITGRNDNPGEIDYIIRLLKILKVDSLRFSIPFGNYNQSFDRLREYKNNVEMPLDMKYRQLLAPYLSTDENDKPYIFYTSPEFTDIDKFTFSQCAYGYYQITFGADGYVYRCSTTATPTMELCRLGEITSDVETFKSMVKINQVSSWNAGACFSRGARCNRMGLEINREYENYIKNL